MAALLLVQDGVSWGNQQTGAFTFLSSLQRSELVLPSCSCARHSEASMASTRCASPSNLFDRLDPPLPRFPSYQQSVKGYKNTRPRVVVENQSDWQLLYVDESFPMSREHSLNEAWSNSEQPSSSGNGDTSNRFTSYGDEQDYGMKRSQRSSPSYTYSSRSRRTMSSGASSQLVPRPLRLKELKGPSGFYVGFVAIMLGLAAVMQKGGLLGTNSFTTTLCSTCDGYGRMPCKLCKGRGSVSWEGKLRHTDLCPLCFGARIRKCSECGGYRAKGDEPPFLRQMARSKPSKVRP